MRQTVKRALFVVAGFLLLTDSVIDWPEGVPAHSVGLNASSPNEGCVTTNCILLRVQNNPALGPHLGSADMSALFNRNWR